MKRITFPFLLMLLMANYAHSQDYVIDLKYDTLYGEATLMLPGNTFEELTLKTEEGKKRFKAYQMVEALVDSAVYKPVKYQDKYRIMKQVKDGYLGLYIFRVGNSYEFGSQYLMKKTTDGMEVPNLSFRKLMMDFLSECPEVTTKIDEKTYKRNDLDKIIDDYNECISNNEATVETTNTEIENISSANQPQLDLINSIRNKIPKNENNELSILLDDIHTKIKNAETIPGYLINALKDQTKGIEGVHNDVEQLINSLK